MVKLNKIYTRTGDDGTTGLVDGSRIAKSDALMAAIGDVDEANSAIGLAICALLDTPHAATLTRIQNDLFDLGAELCYPDESKDARGRLSVSDAQVERLEGELRRYPFAIEGSQQLTQRQVHIVWTVGHHEQQRAVGNAAGDIAHQLGTELVDPVHVFEDHDQGRD